MSYSPSSVHASLVALLLVLVTSVSGQTEVVNLRASDGAHNDQFGKSVSIDGDAVIVGSIRDKDPTNSFFLGAAYIYGRHEGGTDNWGEVIKLLSPDAIDGNDFGYGVAIDGDVAVVGAPSIIPDGDGDGFGAAYIFVRDPGTGLWSYDEKLIPFGGVSQGEFGHSVLIQGDHIFISSPRAGDRGPDAGVVYVFIKDLYLGGTWGLHKKVLPDFGNVGARYGVSIDVDGNTLIVGSNNGGSNATASIHDRNQGGLNNWGLVSKVTASDAESFENYGFAVSVHGTTAAVGASFGDGVVDGSGSAYIYERDHGGASNWGEIAKIIADDGLASDYFGISIVVDTDMVVVGAYLNDTPFASAGSVYLFSRHEGGADNWGLVRNLVTCENKAGSRFGSSVAMDGGSVVVGSTAYLVSIGQKNGQATVFEGIVPGATRDDCNNNGIPDECDIFDATSLDTNANGIPDECEASIDTGSTVLVNPASGGGAPVDDPLVEVTNVSGGAGETVTVSITDDDLHPGASGYSAFGSTASVNTSMADGEFFMTITMPFDSADLAGGPWNPVDLLYFNTVSDAWELAVAANTVNSPGKVSPVGDRFEQSGIVDLVLADLSIDLGDYGVFWNTSTLKGFAWANVDHTTDYASGIDLSCPADTDSSGAVDVEDLLDLLAKWGACPAPCPEDNDGNGVVDVEDLLVLLAAWGACP
ncbi:MAG: hypothetical protein O7G85_16415 [Planctomycetota bacterium]|nr:hypothetical protein [Planctomycetota bacterium]